MEVGDYVRTNYGIAKYIDDEVKSLNLIVINRDIAYNHMDCYKNVIGLDEVIKSSPNIIDLIEVGDYVNGCLVSEIKDKWLILNYADIETYEQLERKNENIKSIVTHEQFETMQYNLESEVN